MKDRKTWLKQAKQLCDSIGPEDGLDPRALAKASARTMSHKNQQFCSAARHAIALVLSGELGDPAFQELELLDVSLNEDGQFIIVTIRYFGDGLLANEQQAASKLQAVQGYLRSAIARSVNRKRVPGIRFNLFSAMDEVGSDADLDDQR